MNALNDPNTSWNGASSGELVEWNRAIPGKGLIASAVGRGGKVEGGRRVWNSWQAGGGRLLR